MRRSAEQRERGSSGQLGEPVQDGREAGRQLVPGEDLAQQVLLGLEVVVEEALGRLELERDVVHGRAREALFGEDFEAGADDLLALPLGAAGADVGDWRSLRFGFHTGAYSRYALVRDAPISQQSRDAVKDGTEIRGGGGMDGVSMVTTPMFEVRPAGPST